MATLKPWPSPLVIVLALVVAAALTHAPWRATQDADSAHFPRTISIYEGSDVRVLGVAGGHAST